jgi:hypothetical protein
MPALEDPTTQSLWRDEQSDHYATFGAWSPNHSDEGADWVNAISRHFTHLVDLK